jgi:hypothetical protein
MWGMRTFLYRCPATGFNVQGLGADQTDAPNENVYEAMTCSFCRGVHLVNPKTGRVAGANARPRRREAAGGHGAGFQGKVLERQKHDLVTAITEQMTGLSNCPCREIWGDQP